METNPYILCSTCQSSFNPRRSKYGKYCCDRCKKIGEKEISVRELEEMLDMSLFRDAYRQATIWMDLEIAIQKHLNLKIIEELTKALEVVDKFTGLDMRQEFLMKNLQGMLKTKKGEW